LHLLGGLLRPDDGGRVLIDGDDLSAISDRALTRYRRDRIGLVFQNYNLIPTLTAEANVRLPLLLSRAKRGERDRIERLLNLLRLAGRRAHYPRQLSGGEQQRVAIGRALANDPAVLLADEPTGNLDLKTTHEICALLRDFRDREDRTIIMVTHAPHVAAWADRVLMFRDGSVVRDAATEDFDGPHDLGAQYQAMLEENDAAAPGGEASECG
jgi:putative ABC transport system ATP-binding protein